MSEHRIALNWSRDGGPFARGNYRPDHVIRYSGGQTLHGSPSAAYMSNDAYAPPEHLLLSALSACHMLTFLAVAANRGYVVDSYSDDAVGILEKDGEGQMAVTRAILAPKVAFSGDKQPSADDYRKMHD